ncbi:MarR family winged helix-turn-helix transcriptional regulator [Paractinoplanes brasiliensis]|uniref:DNA-binding MarR family transcriptional regulator n=1 Tax=Paractinoplanes brasiliensis TaxID=52695 RepID=A0A4R6JAZ3_9ACTN|nr:MarR family transcriptional regulator [Actinoplanes brasiliensis]TDO32682.1 DNA-binding MarR family transcriptional regulator [Actinoplanes brasiliensis]
MKDHPNLAETERAMRQYVESLGLDFAAAMAVSSIYRAANAVRAYASNEVLRPYDLTWTGFVVMWVVWIFDGMETRHAAEAAAISKATLTGVVKTLEGKGLIRKQGREDDRRLVEIHLTDDGKRLMEELYPRFNELEAKVVAGLSREGQHEMTENLRGIVQTIEQIERR